MCIDAGKIEHETGSRSVVLTQFYASFMYHHDFGNNRQPESTTLGLAGNVWLEDFALARLVDTRPVVVHADLHSACAGRGADLDFPSLGRYCITGVQQEIAQCLGEQGTIKAGE